MRIGRCVLVRKTFGGAGLLFGAIDGVYGFISRPGRRGSYYANALPHGEL